MKYNLKKPFNVYYSKPVSDFWCQPGIFSLRTWLSIVSFSNSSKKRLSMVHSCLNLLYRLNVISMTYYGQVCTTHDDCLLIWVSSVSWVEYIFYLKAQILSYKIKNESSRSFVSCALLNRRLHVIIHTSINMDNEGYSIWNSHRQRCVIFMCLLCNFQYH